jgi:hypothetical protein
MVLKTLLSLSYLGLKLKLSYLQTLKTISNQISFVECAYKLFYHLPSFFFYLSPFGILLSIFSLKFGKLLKVVKRRIPPSYPSQKPAHVLTRSMVPRRNSPVIFLDESRKARAPLSRSRHGPPTQGT